MSTRPPPRPARPRVVGFQAAMLAELAHLPERIAQADAEGDMMEKARLELRRATLLNRQEEAGKPTEVQG